MKSLYGLVGSFLILNFIAAAPAPGQSSYSFPQAIEAEPNSILNEAGIVTLSQARTCVGSVSVSDGDFWYLPLGAAGTITVTFHNPNGQSHSTLAVASSAGDYGEGTILGSMGDGETFSFAADAGTYYLFHVTRDAETGSPYYYFDVSGGTLPEYSFTYLTETEPNNFGEGGITTLSRSTTCVGNLGFGDRDYWKLASGISGSVTIALHNPGGLSNSNVSIYSNNGGYGTGTLIGSVYDGTPITFTAEAGKYYILGAFKFAAPGLGDYNLDVSLADENLALHLRADIGVVQSGGIVSQWNDCSLYGNNATQAVPADQPAYIAGALNGYPVVRFNGVTSNLMLPTAADLGIQNSPYELFIVARTGTVGVQFLISGTTTERYEYHLDGAAGARFIPSTAAYLDKSSQGAYSDGQAHVFSGRISYTGAAVRVDGIDGGSSTETLLSSDAGNLYLGVRQSGIGTYPLALNGDIAEVLIYRMNLTPTQRGDLEQSLAMKYGITSGAMPVELMDFTGVCRNGKVMLNWRTSTEINNHGFSIERRAVHPDALTHDSRTQTAEWISVGFVRGSGNSNSPKMYSYMETPTGGTAFQYRLRQIDSDGRCAYSKIVEVSLPFPTEYSLEQNYPNPFNPTTMISFSLPSMSFVSLKIFDVMGREVSAIVSDRLSAGHYVRQWNASGYPSGVYFYRLQADGYSATKRLIMVK